MQTIDEDEVEVRFVRVRDTDSGMVRIVAQLHPDEAALVLKALEVAARRVAGEAHVPAGSPQVWSEGGATSLDNTILLCRRHHGFVHERGYSIARLGGNEIVFLDPRGKLIPHVSAPPALETEDGALLVRNANFRAGIHIGPETSVPHWDGKPVDYDLVLHVLDGMDRREAIDAGLAHP